MNYLLIASELIGTVAFAVSGAMLAVKKELDIFGICFLGIVTALGGGTIRDLLLGITPPRMFYSISYVVLAVSASLVVFFAVRFAHKKDLWSSHRMDTLLTVSDAVGLGVFAVVGTQAGISAGYGDNGFLCIFLGMVTGVGGGVLRDMMCADIPFVLRKHIYAIAAILGGGTYYLLICLGVGVVIATFIGMSATVILRLLAWHYRWNLPKARSHANSI